MNRQDANALLERFLSAKKHGKAFYLDAEEVAELLDCLDITSSHDLYDNILSAGLQMHPGDTDLQVRKCWRYVELEKYEAALDYLEEIGDVGDYYLNIARLECYCLLDCFDKVVELMDKMLNEEGRDEMEIVFEHIIPLLNDYELVAESQHFLLLGLKLYPENRLLQEEFCYLLEITGNYTEALRLCNALIDAEPFYYDYWFMLGRLYILSEDYNNALEAFEYAAVCEEPEEDLSLFRAHCFYKMKDYDRAISQYAALLALATDETVIDNVLSLLSACYIQKGDDKKAFHLLCQWFLDSNPLSMEDLYESFLYYMRCCAITGKEKEALDDLEEVMATCKGSDHLLRQITYAYRKFAKENDDWATLGRFFDRIGKHSDWQKCLLGTKDPEELFIEPESKENTAPVNKRERSPFEKSDIRKRLASEYLKNKVHCN